MRWLVAIGLFTLMTGCYDDCYYEDYSYTYSSHSIELRTLTGEVPQLAYQDCLDSLAMRSIRGGELQPASNWNYYDYTLVYGDTPGNEHIIVQCHTQGGDTLYWGNRKLGHTVVTRKLVRFNDCQEGIYDLEKVQFLNPAGEDVAYESQTAPRVKVALP